MPDAVIHPTPQELADFGLGKLPQRAAAVVAAHLESCAACRQAVAGVSADSFLDKVRDARQGATPLSPSLAKPASAPSSAHRPAMPIVPCPDLPPELARHPKYLILRELGRGGMGVVYQARQTVMNRPVVIKVINRLLLEQPDALERFRREVQAAAQLSHSNIVTAYDAEQAGELHMLVMEFVPGQNLAEVLEKKGPLPVTNACHYARQVAVGLQHAYERGMVHRDIKPGNLMLTPKGQIKILDFGLAKVVSERGTSKGLTSFDACMGTPEYCSPEQAEDARTADTRADLYSLGCTLYHLLAGRPPFREDTAMKTFLAHIQKAPQPLTELRSEVPDRLWRVVARLLAKKPERRYQKPIEVVQALAPFVKAGAKGASTQAKRVGSPARGTMIATDTDQTKHVLREEPGKAPPTKASAKEVRRASERGRSAPASASFSLTGVLSRFGRKGCVLTAAVSVSFALMLTLMTGILLFTLNKREKSPDAVALKNQPADAKATLGNPPGFPSGQGILWPRFRPPAPPSDAVVLDISGVADANTREAISEELIALGKAAGVSNTNISNLGNGMRVSLWPVKDVQAFTQKLEFGTVNSVNGRTITLTAHKVEWPSSQADAVTKALNQLKLPNAHKRYLALLKLKDAPPDEHRAEVVNTLKSLLDNTDFITRKFAIKALCVWGDKDVIVPLLLKAMQDKDTRGEAMKALGRLKVERAAEPIAQRLENLQDRHDAAEALKQMGPIAEEAVLARLNHPDWFVRLTACEILGDIGTQQSIPLLEKVAAAGRDIRAVQKHIVANKAVEAIVAIKGRKSNR